MISNVRIVRKPNVVTFEKIDSLTVSYYKRTQNIKRYLSIIPKGVHYI